MQLHAAGLNAWNQLNFEPSPIDDEPDDIFSFANVLEAQQIGRIGAQISYTAVHRNKTWCLAGASPDGLLGVGSTTGSLLDRPSAISAGGKVLTVAQREEQDTLESSQAIVEYPHLAAWKANESTHCWPSKSKVRQIAAYDAGFIILHEDGSVSTSGDPRFVDCLGREANEFNSPNVPSTVPDLNDLGEPIKKVAAGGYTVAALTQGGGLYLWGAESTGSHSRHRTFSDLSGIPNYVEVDGDKDVEDIAVGESHAIALTTDGSIYVVGDNTNGQLGMGRDFKGPAESWVHLAFNPPPGCKIVGVEAGPRSSFVITAKTNQK
ncbi:hypothetical protein NM208_g15940 [Fusarium decemcellulare]|uniref:Uncharacterized protein n=1 Tax=Fusarium decemcellulare TaxID=57161 RepID=A0ACC1RC56_9HYPO|nr:hypothetical protein NM208_g15940 [Fusarium decemcellulare]